MNLLWLWLCRFAYRRLKQSKGRFPNGVPTVRDVDSRCHAYEPRKRQLGDFRDCQGDGHYLCAECCHLAPIEPEAVA